MTTDKFKKLEYILSGTNVSQSERDEIIDLIDECCKEASTPSPALQDAKEFCNCSMEGSVHKKQYLGIHCPNCGKIVGSFNNALQDAVKEIAFPVRYDIMTMEIKTVNDEVIAEFFDWENDALADHLAHCINKLKI